MREWVQCMNTSISRQQTQLVWTTSVLLFYYNYYQYYYYHYTHTHMHSHYLCLSNTPPTHTHTLSPSVTHSPPPPTNTLFIHLGHTCWTIIHLKYSKASLLPDKYQKPLHSPAELREVQIPQVFLGRFHGCDLVLTVTFVKDADQRWLELGLWHLHNTCRPTHKSSVSTIYHAWLVVRLYWPIQKELNC